MQSQLFIGKNRYAVSPSKPGKTVPVIGLFPVPTSFKVKETIQLGKFSGTFFSAMSTIVAVVSH